MGSPGCGKTTTGQLLSARLGRPVTDIDDDFLEPYWGMPVAHKVIDTGVKTLCKNLFFKVSHKFH